MIQSVEARGLTVEDLRTSRLPDSSLGNIWSEFVSRADRRYTAVHVAKHPGPYVLLAGDNNKDEADFRQVAAIVAREVSGVPTLFGRGSRPLRELLGNWDAENISIYDRTDDITNVIRLAVIPTQRMIAGFVERYVANFKDVTIPFAHYYGVPEGAYENPGFPSEKLKIQHPPGTPASFSVLSGL